MAKCYVYPSQEECRSCMMAAEYFDDIPNCDNCTRKQNIYNFIEFVHSVWGDYALVSDNNGKVHKCYIENLRFINEN